MKFDNSWAQAQEATGEILKRVPAIILVGDASGSIIYANDAVETFLGYRPEEVLGDRWWHLTRSDPEERRRAKEFVRQSVADGVLRNSEPYEERLFDRKGQPRYIVWRDVLGPNGMSIGVGQDVTERRSVEEQLRNAKREAEISSRAKTDFLANMSHEIRTPMNAVTGASSLLLDSELDPKQKELVEVIRSSGMNLLGLVSDILDLSRIESGSLDLESHPFKIHDCIESTIGAVALQAANKGLDVGFEIDTPVPALLEGDETRLRQVLVNLMANAVKFTRTGWVLARVTSGATLADGRIELLFSVQDTGIGIPEDRQESVFETFSQVDASTSRRYGGTGLGLAISRRLCEMMGGAIWLESEPGLGSIFRFSVLVGLPAVEDDGYSVTQALATVLQRKALLFGLPPATRRVLRSWLSRWGVSMVEPAEHELEHLDLQTLDLDLAFVRVSKPSRTAARLVKSLSVLEVPILAVTGLTEKLSRTSQRRVAGQVIMPLRPTELESSLRKVFGLLPLAAETVAEEDLPQVTDLRVLLGEDNPINQMIALMMLESLGLEADVAANGLEVLKALSEKPYDVVLMDVQMPELDGLETTRRIRDELHSRVQIIAVTANAMAGDRERCLEAGMDYYISKPFQVDVLHRVLSECRRVSEVGASGGSQNDSRDSAELCPFITRCPMFPLFENEPIRRVYQIAYCKADFGECHRYNLAIEGTMPDPRLLPDGAMLPKPSAQTGKKD